MGNLKVSKPFTVLIDLDSTVYDILTPTLAWLKAERGINLALTDLTEWHVWGTEKDTLKYAYSLWQTPGFFKNLKLFPHVKASLQKVADWGVQQLFASTLVAGPTVAWDKLQAIDRDFPFIGMCNVLLTGSGKGRFRGDMLVDDGPHNLDAFGAWDYTSTVLARLQEVGYNKNYSADYCLTDWRQYPEIVAQEMKKRG